MAHTESTTRSKAWSLSPKTIAAITAGVLAAVFVLQNTDEKHVRFLFWSWSMPAWIWLLADLRGRRRRRVDVPLAAPPAFVTSNVVGSVSPTICRSGVGSSHFRERWSP